jgi:N-acetyl-alpha-D-glucosaminyl L-malate synthase BshA
MRVKMVIYCFHPIIGGAERHTETLAKALIERGIGVSVVTTRFPGLASFELIDGIPVHRISSLWAMRPAYGWKGYMHILTYLVALFAYLVRHRNEYDIIHIQQALFPAVAGVLAGKMLGKKTIVQIHTAGSGEADDVGQLRLRRSGMAVLWALRGADAVVSISRAMTAELQALDLKGLLAFIPSIVSLGDHARYEPAPVVRQRLGLPSGPLVTCVARLTPQKAHDILLRAWPMVLSRYPDAHLVLVGSGPEETRLRRLADSLGITGRVYFAGEQREVAPYLAASDVFVLPSRAEGLGLALMEAMSAGLPCVASRVGGIPDLIEDGQNGLLVEPEDVAGLAKALLKLLEDRKLAKKLGDRARQFIIQNYNPDVIVSQYISLYRQLYYNMER